MRISDWSSDVCSSDLLIAPERYADPLGTTTVGDFAREQVLRLSYTAHDLAGFARDLGYDGEPFVWDPEDRRHRIARRSDERRVGKECVSTCRYRWSPHH